MVLEPTLAARAANAETAIRSLLRGEHDDWVASALREGLGVCRQLLAGVQESQSVSYFSEPDTREGILFFESKYPENSEEVLRDLVRKLGRVVESGSDAMVGAHELESSLDIFRGLSLRLCEQDQLIERTLA